MSLSQTLLPMPFKRSDNKVKSRMLSVPEKLRTAAMELLARVRVGLDIPSRAEVLDLAARIEAISTQMSRLEASRAADNKLVDELRQSAQGNGRTQGGEGEPKRRADRKPRTVKSTSAKAAPVKSEAKKKTAAGTAGQKRKPRSRSGAAGTKDADK